MIRGQTHGLVLFYVNRLASHNTQLNTHLVSTLNELTRETAAQQEEIENLRAEIRALKEERP